MRIYSISDIHIDYSENEQWVLNVSKYDFTSDILILAGDISQKLSLIDKSFKYLTKCFKKVLFVPGNHDLWVVDELEKNSINKYLMLKKIAKDNGVITGSYIDGNVSIVPLLGWFDYSFAPLNDFLKKSWSDFYFCKWPNQMDVIEATDYFIDLNRNNLYTKNETIISFSHFMPRIDLISNFKPLDLEYLFPVMGSSKIEDQIRTLNSDIHVYGHIHIASNQIVDGVNYICNPLGYPKESKFVSSDLKLVYEF